MTPFQPYIDFILSQRDWSWTVVGVMYLLAAGLVRSWFLSPVSAQLRTLESALKRKVEFAYLKESLLGWIFFFIPLALIILTWRREALVLKIGNEVAAISGVASFVFSVVFHLAAYGRAALSVLKTSDDERRKVL